MDILTGEDALLAVIDRHFPNLLGIGGPARGDDCAALAGPGALLVSTDLFLEDVHFRTGYFLPEEIGHKALAVNISDIAAMGGKPLHFSMGLGLPHNMPPQFFTNLCSGMALLAEEYGMFLSGGDLSASERLLLSITITGTYWPEAAGTPPCFLKRAAARPGDAIFCFGSIGLARTGLALLESRGRAAIEESPAACAAHLKPSPLVNAGRCLALAARASGEAERFGLMDVSDGLARDLPRLIGPGKGAAIDGNHLPIHGEAKSRAGALGLDPIQEALLGGEDYALAGTCPASHMERLNSALPGMAWIGTVTDRPGLLVDGTPAREPGFDHFCRANV